MAQPIVSDDTIWAMVALVRQHGSVSAAARAANLPRNTVANRISEARRRFPGCLPEANTLNSGGWAASSEKPKVRVRAWRLPDEDTQDERRQALRGEIGGPPIPSIAMPPEGFVVRRNSGQYDADGNLQRQWIETGRGGTETYTPPAGHIVKGESTLVDGNGVVMAKWVKTKFEQSDQLIKGLQEAFAEYEGLSPLIPEPPAGDDDILTEYPIPDLHLGALSWARESGENYDVKIAVDTATKSIRALVDQSRSSSEAVLLFMGDFTHSNDEKGITPASGHALDNDGRWHKNYAAAAHLAVALVEIVAQKHPKVSVRVLKGNHDPDAAVCLSVGLSLYYNNNPRINIEDDPSITWYRKFGRCLLAATHGHTQKPEAMAMAMAVDCAEDWGQTTYRHIAYGHIHHATAKEIMGVHVESFQAISARDAYSAQHGFRSGRSVSAITWHREHGEIGRHRVNISGASPRAEAA